MKYRLDKDKIFITLSRGDEIVECLSEVAIKEKLESGWVLGIGAMEDVEVGYFDFPTRSYQNQSFDGEFELLSLSGNITLKDDVPFVHPHVTFSGPDFKVLGGHLFNGTISAAGEFVILRGNITIPRTMDDHIKLALWNLED